MVAAPVRMVPWHDVGVGVGVSVGSSVGVSASSGCSMGVEEGCGPARSFASEGLGVRTTAAGGAITVSTAGGVGEGKDAPGGLMGVALSSGIGVGLGDEADPAPKAGTRLVHASNMLTTRTISDLRMASACCYSLHLCRPTGTARPGRCMIWQIWN